MSLPNSSDDEEYYPRNDVQLNSFGIYSDAESSSREDEKRPEPTKSTSHRKRNRAARSARSDDNSGVNLDEDGPSSGRLIGKRTRAPRKIKDKTVQKKQTKTKGRRTHLADDHLPMPPSSSGRRARIVADSDSTSHSNPSSFRSETLQTETNPEEESNTVLSIVPESEIRDLDFVDFRPDETWPSLSTTSRRRRMLKAFVTIILELVVACLLLLMHTYIFKINFTWFIKPRGITDNVALLIAYIVSPLVIMYLALR